MVRPPVRRGIWKPDARRLMSVIGALYGVHGASGTALGCTLGVHARDMVRAESLARMVGGGGGGDAQ